MTKIELMGCGFVEPDNFILDVPNSTFYLILLTHSPSVFWVDGEMKAYPENRAVFFRPGYKVLYGACGGPFINDWISFSTTDNFITTAPLPQGVPFELKHLDYCSKLIQLIFTENCMDGGSYKDLSITNLIATLVNKFLESVNGGVKSIHYLKLMELRKEIINNAKEDWTVKRMADTLHISPGYLQALYKSAFGVSCMEDVINSRVKLAEGYLAGKGYLISEIAAKCGYKSTEHFYRQFKKVTGCTPNDYVRCL